MPTISAIKPQKNKKRVNIYLDGKFAFGLDLETLVKLGLKVEQELTKEDVEKIVKEAEFQKVYDKILKFGSLRPRSEKEYKDWLRKHKVHPSLRNEIFNRLKRLDFLNDRRFAVWWVEQRTTFRPKSARILRLELINKGISKELIEDVLAEANIDEVAIAKRLIRRKAKLWEKLDSYETRKKKAEFLSRNGFDWEVIRKILGEEQLE